jgi:hypothetical protein
MTAIVNISAWSSITVLLAGITVVTSAKRKVSVDLYYYEAHSTSCLSRIFRKSKSCIQDYWAYWVEWQFQYPSRARICKTDSTEGSSVETIARDGKCQIFSLKFHGVFQYTELTRISPSVLSGLYDNSSSECAYLVVDVKKLIIMANNLWSYKIIFWELYIIAN